VERDGRRTVVVAGDVAGPDAALVARAAAWPLLAEPSSGAAGPGAVAAYRLLLELPELGGNVERVVAFGRPTLSRPVARLLSRPDVELVLVSGDDAWPDPGRPVRRVPRVDPASVAATGDTPDDGWARRWERASSAARAALDEALDAEQGFSGLVVARALASAARSGETLVAAASNPIRDLDLVGHALPAGLRVLANRGLAGIDGTLSTASGVALDGGLVRALVGDLAFLHDVGALLVPPGEVRPHLQVVVLNDDGGGIFSLLEQGELATQGPAEAAVFERLFGTPHGADLGALCRGYGVPHARAETAEALRSALAVPPPGISVVEVRADRGALRELHERIRSRVHSAARAALRLT
jgi:2-succinyl-5-enolpyruvyl-6-hydroxy-3-cyclohexene-1-carboxylate synthase